MESAREKLERLVGKNHVAVVNADNEFFGLSNFKRAMTILHTGVAEPIIQRTHPRIVKSPSREIALPLVVSIKRKRKPMCVELDGDDTVEKMIVLRRDGYTCQYCGEYGDTVDHVFPKSQGGPHSWDNLVAACKDCNGQKSDLTLDQIGWSLPERPSRDLELEIRQQMYENSSLVKALNEVLPQSR